MAYNLYCVNLRMVQPSSSGAFSIPQVCMNLLKRTMVMLPLIVMVVIVWVRVTLTYTAEDLEAAEMSNNSTTISDDYDDSGGGNQTTDSLILTALMHGKSGGETDS